VTLVVAVALDDGRVWMGGDRIAGGMDYHELAGPKVFSLETPDRVPFLAGFAGSPRVAQAVLAVHPPERDLGNRSLHWWLTEYCDAIHAGLSDRGLIRDDGGTDEPFLACHTGILLAIEGHVVLVGRDLSWEITTRGWRAIGVAFETFSGAYEVLRASHARVAAARLAWPVVQRFHRVGDLADELELRAAGAVHPGPVAGASSA